MGVLCNQQGQLLVQQRREGTDCAGHWEFPGGKLETGESAEQALERELQEELGIILGVLGNLACLEHDYEHAKVRLHTFLCREWQGKAMGMEGQTILWAEPSAVRELNLLDAAFPLLDLAEKQLGLAN